jgi:cold shock CspA family protein
MVHPKVRSGTVRWFSVEKGYGFITADNGDDVFMHVKNLEDRRFIPDSGNGVRFVMTRTPKGLQAIKIQHAPECASVPLTATRSDSMHQPAQNNKSADNRPACSGCGRSMVPRIITSNGRLDRSVCPFCGKTYQRFAGNYIGWIVSGITIFVFIAIASSF